MDRDFKGVWIPKEVWLDNRLSALDKMVLVEIDSLDREESGCYASNKYLAEFCQCSETKVSNAISKLKELGYVTAENFDGRQRVLRGCLTKNARQPYKKCEADLQKMQAINIVNYNNREIKKERKKEGTTFDEIINEYSSSEELREALIEFIKMRKLIKKPLTDYALKRLLSKLDTLATTNADKTAVVNQSITRGWAGFFEVKQEGKRAKSSANRYQEANVKTNEKLLNLLGGNNERDENSN